MTSSFLTLRQKIASIAQSLSLSSHKNNTGFDIFLTLVQDDDGIISDEDFQRMVDNISSIDESGQNTVTYCTRPQPCIVKYDPFTSSIQMKMGDEVILQVDRPSTSGISEVSKFVTDEKIMDMTSSMVDKADVDTILATATDVLHQHSIGLQASADKIATLKGQFETEIKAKISTMRTNGFAAYSMIMDGFSGGAIGVLNAIKAILQSGNSIEEADGNIEWVTNDQFAVDTSMWQVIGGVLGSIAQLIGMVVLIFSKVIGLIITAIGSLLSWVTELVAQWGDRAVYCTVQDYDPAYYILPYVFGSVTDVPYSSVLNSSFHNSYRQFGRCAISGIGMEHIVLASADDPNKCSITSFLSLLADSSPEEMLGDVMNFEWTWTEDGVQHYGLRLSTKGDKFNVSQFNNTNEVWEYFYDKVVTSYYMSCSAPSVSPLNEEEFDRDIRLRATNSLKWYIVYSMLTSAWNTQKYGNGYDIFRPYISLVRNYAWFGSIDAYDGHPSTEGLNKALIAFKTLLGDGRWETFRDNKPLEWTDFLTQSGKGLVNTFYAPFSSLVEDDFVSTNQFFLSVAPYYACYALDNDFIDEQFDGATLAELVPDVQYGFDSALVPFDNSSVYLQLPNTTKSAMLWGWIISGLTVAALTVGITIASIKLKKWKYKRSVDAQANKAKTWQAYLADPSAANLKAFKKATKKEARWASMVGGSSLSPASVVEDAKAVAVSDELMQQILLSIVGEQ